MLGDTSNDSVADWHSRCLMEDCVDDTPWLTDTERKLIDILSASSLHFVRCCHLPICVAELQIVLSVLNHWSPGARRGI